MRVIEWSLTVSVVALHALAIGLLLSSKPSPAQMPPPIMQVALLPAPVAERPAAPKAPPVETIAQPQPQAKPRPEQRPKPSRPHQRTAKPRKRELPKPLPLTALSTSQPAIAPPTESTPAADSQPTAQTLPTVEYIAPTATSSRWHNPAPDYPPTSRKKKEQGVVWISVHIDAKGNLLELTLKQSSGFTRLDQAALRAVRQWRFEPATRQGQPVSAWYDLPVRFSLKAAKGSI